VASDNFLQLQLRQIEEFSATRIFQRILNEDRKLFTGLKFSKRPSLPTVYTLGKVFETALKSFSI